MNQQLASWGVLPFNYKKVNDYYLITTRFGTWCILNKVDFDLLNSYKIEDSSMLYKTLSDTGIIINEINSNKIISNFRNLNRNLFLGPGLHIISMTSACNYDCTYCHAGSPTFTKKFKQKSLNKEGADKILKLIFQSPNKSLTIEFQGGEPTLNWPILTYIIQKARKINESEDRILKLALVTNLSTMNQEKIEFFKEYRVHLSTSLDGHKELHNKNRPFVNGSGTYDTVSKWIQIIQKEQNLSIGALTTLTKESLNYPIDIVNEYVNQGFNSIHLRFLNYLGEAKKNWETIGYTAEDFINFWITSMDHILDLNKKGIKIQERLTTMMLMKIFLKKDPMYTELMSPCGAGRGQILYNEDGNIYTCDEGRMLGEDVFKMGSINDSYDKIMTSAALQYAAETSLMDNYAPDDVFLPWIGVCPVVNFSHNNHSIAKLPSCMTYQIYQAQFKYIFEKMITDPHIEKIFKSWVGIQS